MSEHLKKFLVDLAADPERMSRFEANPAGELDGTALSEDEKSALLSRDSGRLRDALGVTADHMTFIRGIRALKISIKASLIALKQMEAKEKELAASASRSRAPKKAAKRATRKTARKR